MSSSANRRPRVAGQRRRPQQVSEDPTLETTKTTPQSTPEAVPTDAASAGADAPTDPTLHTGLWGRLRSRTRPDPATDDAGSAGDDAAETEVEAAPARSRGLLVPAVALALSLALLASLLLLTREDPAQRARDASAASATARSTLEQILSYNHATMTQQIPASQALLTGSFKDEFAETMSKTIVPMATKDKTVVKARAYEVGVMSQRDDTVIVQAFVNQARTSDAQKEPSVDQNRVIATMSRVGNRWLVSELKAY